jgi:hypothetical protein
VDCVTVVDGRPVHAEEEEEEEEEVVEAQVDGR